ncbi:MULTISPECIES: LuxR C-terminal-related transcriptional regulator [Protofrankia]|uniref:Regulatory protein LuxR n=1 Tax=Candidatus Protofrankia datiscae TaxID=2716812 RepID=F8B671_9ACTN|nr:MULTISPECIES: LuxR C-terminal-related transcriptional regulator [Protofrankia]AEH08041.1 regulatory protein LuxR [Candidatus Protofrankia datiscae]
MLDLLGIDDIALAAYRLWLRRKDMSAEEVGIALGCSTTTIRQACDRLVELSLLVPSRENPDRLVAVHPEVPLEQLFRQQHDQLIRRQEELIRARMQVSTLVADYMQGRPPEPAADIVRLKGVAAVTDQLLDLVAQAKRELLVLHTRLWQPSIMTAECSQAALQALRRGVAIRAIRPRPAQGDDAPAGCDLVNAQGLELRMADAPLADVAIADRETALLLLASDPDDERGCALLLQEPALTGLVTMLFDQLWKAARPLERTGELDQAELRRAGLDHIAFGQGALGDSSDSSTVRGLTGQANLIGQASGLPSTKKQRIDNTSPNDSERLLLRLLSLGAKDEAAARHLGVSVRTVRRMIADLMRRMDARSRFQAGILAAKKDWL